MGTYANLKSIEIAICMVGLFSGPVQWAHAAPLAFESNFYEFVQVADPYYGGNNTWATASAAASARVFNGLNGHLATVTSQAENDFLYDLVSGSFSDFTGAWLGGKASEGWLVGPEIGQGFSFTNWGGIEPNNAGYVYMNIGSPYFGINSGRWADHSGGVSGPDYRDPVIGYFVEYEGASPVPEPASMLLFGAGLAGLAGIRLKKKK